MALSAGTPEMTATLGLMFLDPAAGAVAGAIAAPALLLLYFLKLRRRPVRVSAAFLWERAAEDLQVNVPLRWLRASWLLLLQLAALGLLCAALARPAVESDAVGGGRVILLIDASAAMSARDVRQADGKVITRLERAKEEAKRIIDRLPLGAAGSSGGDGRTQAMVVSFARTGKIEASPTGSRSELRRAVEGIEATDQPADLESALQLVRSSVEGVVDPDEERRGSRPTLIMLGGGWYERPPESARSGVGGAEARYTRVGPEPDAPRDNLGIAAMSARRDEESPSVARVFVRLVNAAPTEVEAPITIRVNGVAARVTALPVPGVPAVAGGREEREDRRAERVGERSASFVVDAPGRSLIEVVIEREDALASDNTAAVVLDAPRTPRVLLVAPTDPQTAGPRPDAAILHALRVVAGGARVTAWEEAQTEDLSRGGWDLIVFDRVTPTTLPDAPTVSFGAGLPVEGLALGEASAEPTPIVSWRRAHPLMRGVVLDALVAPGARALTLPEGATALATGREGPLIGLLERGGVGRIVVGFAVEPSRWWLNVSFAVFVANAVEHLAGFGETAISRSFTTVERCAARVAAGATRLRVSGPAQADMAVEERPIVGPATPGSGPMVSLGVLPRAGVYRVEGAAESDMVVPVNLLDGVSSSLATAEAVDIGGQAVRNGTGAGSAPREVWPWFALSAVAVLCMEWFLFAWRMRV